MFTCLDDKHRVPVGKPGYPVASVERGKRVIVSRNTDFLAADHDFTCMLFLYTDGGPDHRITYLSVQLSLISIFLSLDLDYLYAVRTAPAQSRKNPVERIMSILNLGLQSVGLMRTQGSERAEQKLKNCKNLSQVRAAVADDSSLAGEISDSIEPVKILLSDIFQRLLHLKEKKCKDVSIGHSVSNAGIKQKSRHSRRGQSH